MMIGLDDDWMMSLQGRMRGSPCASLFVFDQMFKYRDPPPTYAHILLTAPQKRLRLAS